MYNNKSNNSFTIEKTKSNKQVYYNMGVELRPIIIKEKTNLNAFSSRIVAVDAYNTLYQFLTIIRGANGLQLVDSYGNVTSHISGLFYRNINFLSLGIKPVYVFDGKPPSLKSYEIKKRKKLKKNAIYNYKKAVHSNDIESIKKFAQQTVSINDIIIKDSKYILSLFGIPYIQAPSEGEATAAHLTSINKAFAVASQDFDSILFGAKRLVRNFTLGGKRKIPNKNRYIEIEPELIDNNKFLSQYDLSQNQIVDIGILIGTDFNPDGFPKIGPKTALRLIQQYSKLENIPQIKDELDKIDYNKIRKIFLKPKVATIDEIKFREIDYDEITKYMVNRRNFSSDRIRSSLGKLKISIKKSNQTLEKWFG